MGEQKYARSWEIAMALGAEPEKRATDRLRILKTTVTNAKKQGLAPRAVREMEDRGRKAIESDYWLEVQEMREAARGVQEKVRKNWEKGLLRDAQAESLRRAMAHDRVAALGKEGRETLVNKVVSGEASLEYHEAQRLLALLADDGSKRYGDLRAVVDAKGILSPWLGDEKAQAALLVEKKYGGMKQGDMRLMEDTNVGGKTFDSVYESMEDENDAE